MANVATGKAHRGLAVVYIGQALNSEPLSKQDTGQLCMLGCLVEMMQAHYLILDDIMDDSITRRGATCWYRRPEIGTMAINDACILKSCIFWLLQEFFKSHEAYHRFTELFINGGLQTELGQLCDLDACKEQQIESFTLDKYSFLVKYKSSYSVEHPIVLALEFFHLGTAKNVAHVHEFAMAVGEYFQVHNDYTDVFGDQSGATGTDIRDNKCTWFICKAMVLADETQRQQLQAAYGKKDVTQVERVKSLFVELNLEQAYEDYCKSQREKIVAIVAATDESEGLKRHMLQALFDGFKQGR